MRELWRTRREARVGGWRLAAELAVRMCCRTLAPLLEASARRHGRLGAFRATVELSTTPKCHRPD